MPRNHNRWNNNKNNTYQNHCTVLYQPYPANFQNIILHRVETAVCPIPILPFVILFLPTAESFLAVFHIPAVPNLKGHKQTTRSSKLDHTFSQTKKKYPKLSRDIGIINKTTKFFFIESIDVK